MEAIGTQEQGKGVATERHDRGKARSWLRSVAADPAGRPAPRHGGAVHQNADVPHFLLPAARPQTAKAHRLHTTAKTEMDVHLRTSLQRLAHPQRSGGGDNLAARPYTRACQDFTGWTSTVSHESLQTTYFLCVWPQLAVR